MYKPLGTYVTLQRGTTYASALLGKPGPVLLGLASIARNGGFRADSLRTYGGESPTKLILKPGELYVSLKDVTQSGDLLGAIARVPNSVKAGRLTQDTVKVELNAAARADYIYWVLRTPQYRAYCRERAIGTTNLSLSRDDFLAFKVPEPTEQRLALVALLESLDDKIATNKSCVEVAHELAELNFQLAMARGSRTAVVGEIAAVFDGPHATPKKTTSGPWFLSISSLQGGRLVLAESAHLGEEDFVRWTRRVTPKPGDVLFSYETRLGEAALMPDGLRACLGRRMALLRPHSDRVGPLTLLHAFLNDSFQETIRQRAVHGATVDRIPLTDLPSWPIAFPSQADRIETLLRGLDDLAAQRERENETLAVLREAMLRELISGKIRLSEKVTL